MRRRQFITVLGGAVVFGPLSAWAQQSLPLIAVLEGASAASTTARRPRPLPRLPPLVVAELDIGLARPVAVITGAPDIAPSGNDQQEFVRAVEGVPRDALNLAAKIATKAYGMKITMSHVRNAARDWYQQDKQAVIRGNPELNALLAKVIDEIIGRRKARAFLFSNNIRDDRIEQLFDARLLHVLKKNISSNDEPGVRYDVYKIDYGCYVDLVNTSKAPNGLFEIDEGYVEVPRDDYRSIRRAILRPEAFDGNGKLATT
jgi:hypothetical protein